MVNKFSGNGFNTPRESLRSLRVAVILMLEVDVLTVKPGTVEMTGAAETVAT